MPESDTSSLLAFVEARITEDELWAKAASAQPSHYADERPVPATGTHWTWAVGENWTPYRVDPLEEFVGEGANDYGPSLVTVEEWPSRYGKDRMSATKVLGGCEEVATGVGGHIVRHDPARVLREVEAKRAILAAVRKYLDPHPGQECDHDGNPWGECVLHAAATGRVSAEVLPLLAMAWADHPDFCSIWNTGEDDDA